MPPGPAAVTRDELLDEVETVWFEIEDFCRRWGQLVRVRNTHEGPRPSPAGTSGGMPAAKNVVRGCAYSTRIAGPCGGLTHPMPGRLLDQAPRTWPCWRWGGSPELSHDRARQPDFDAEAGR
jgi:hypothetical protein